MVTYKNRLEFETPEDFSVGGRIQIFHKYTTLGYCNLLRNGTTATIADIYIYDHSRPILRIFPYIKIGKNHRNHGIGSALLKYVINYCKEQNIYEIVGQVQGELAILIPWYEKHGFIIEKDDTIYMNIKDAPSESLGISNNTKDLIIIT
jgi:GNAT superfamily N-acetyltransferase